MSGSVSALSTFSLIVDTATPSFAMSSAVAGARSMLKEGASPSRTCARFSVLDDHSDCVLQGRGEGGEGGEGGRGGTTGRAGVTGCVDGVEGGGERERKKKTTRKRTWGERGRG